MAKSKKSSGLSGGELALAALAVAGVGYVLLKPKTAEAAPPPPPAPAATKLCPDGSVVLVSDPCPTILTPTVAPYTVIASGTSSLTPTAGAIPVALAAVLGAFPVYLPINDPADGNPIPIDAADALVFVQAFTPAGAPIFGGTAYPSVVLKGPKVADATDIAKLMDPTSKDLTTYFTPTLLTQLKDPNYVLVWTTDSSGSPLGWWLMIWSPS